MCLIICLTTKEYKFHDLLYISMKDEKKMQHKYLCEVHLVHTNCSREKMYYLLKNWDMKLAGSRIIQKSCYPKLYPCLRCDHTEYSRGSWKFWKCTCDCKIN